MSRIIVKLLAGTILCGALIYVGCNRYLESSEPDQKLPNAPVTPINVQAQIENQSVSLSWQLTDSSGVSRFRVYVADSTEANYILRDSTTAYSLIIAGLLVNHRYFFRVSTVGAGGIEGERSAPVSTRVGLLSVTINNDDPYTNRRDVSIQLVAPSGTSHVILSEDPDLTGANPQFFNTTVSFTLSDGDAVKTVYGRFVLSDGSQSGAAVSDQITLDTRASIDSVFFVSSSTPPYEAGDIITFRIDAGETGGSAIVDVAGGPSITLFDDGANGDALAGDGIYTARYTVPTNVTVNNAQVTGRFTDAAGNVASQAVAATRITISNPPQPVQFTLVEAISSSQIELSWGAAEAGGFQYYRLYRSATSTVTSASVLVKTITNRLTTTHSDTALGADATYYYRMFVYNLAGQRDSSAVASARTLPVAPPQPVVLAGVYQSSSTSAVLTWTQNNDRDFAYYLVYRGTAADTLVGQLLTIINTSVTTTYADPLPDSTPYYYWIAVTDTEGLTSESNRVVVQQQ
ncbi:MAG: fibronectin type III domain-containing protein [Candidatus Zixiibacteriota bacterium]